MKFYFHNHFGLLKRFFFFLNYACVQLTKNHCIKQSLKTFLTYYLKIIKDI